MGVHKEGKIMGRGTGQQGKSGKRAARGEREEDRPVV